MTGNVGIGSSDPQQQLDLGSGNLITTGTLYAGNLSGNGSAITNINYNSISGTPNLSSKQDTLTFNAPLTKSTNTIGLSINASTLQVTDGNLNVINLSGTPNVTVGSITTTSDIISSSANDLIFKPGNAEKMRLTQSTGRLGIGSTIPTERLDLGDGNLITTGILS